MHRETAKRIEQLISKLSDTQMCELFKVFKKNKCSYTINSNGVFLNLSWLSEEALIDIEKYIIFCIESTNKLNEYEQEYSELDKKINNNETVIENTKDDVDKVKQKNKVESIRPQSRVSSSMKFYLLKKKFSRNNSIQLPICKDILTKDKPLICK
jgi:hypothetical protein